MNPRSRGWCFTINNPTEWDDADLERLIPDCQYLVYGKETGENDTPHYQGFVYFKERKSFTYIKGILSRAHLEPQKGSNQQAIDYCKKDGDFIEIGEKPAGPKGQKEKWRTVLQLAKEGKMDIIARDYPAILIRYYPRLSQFYRPQRPLILDNIENEWWVGPTGSGKSRLLWERYPGHYQKSLNKWWDNYIGQETVAIEEWSPKNEVTASFLKIWADRYPFSGEIKGGTLQYIRPRRIIVLSNYTIEECFVDSQDKEPILRRFRVVQFHAL